ncbi:MAG: AhpC/TSA family protein [Bacteroidia bacterium]|nr:MAG: AhpC/TSA family protein [Bacteroidia bacterium]
MAKFNLILITLVVLLSGCNEKKFVINGTLTDAMPGTIIYLDKLGSSEIESIDSIALDEAGKFRIGSKSSSPQFYLLRSSSESFLTTMIEPGEKLTIRAHADSLNFPAELSGSPGTQLMIDYNIRLQETLAQLGELNLVYEENIDNPDLAGVMQELDLRAQVILEGMTIYTREYIDSNLPSLICLIALYQQVVPQVYVLNPEEDIDYFVKVDSTLFSLYPDYEPVKFLHEQVATLVLSLQGQNIPGGAPGIGSVAPEIILPTPEGTMTSLSSTRGKVVLLDFWAGWCPPCRAENPNIVSAFNKYSDKGFTVFQVSLDQEREIWLNAIEADALGGWYHVSDLKYWDSEVVSLYGFESIPANYLLDVDGRVIASNLRGDALQQKLEEIFR